MKKLLSILLALTLVFTMSITAFAAPVEDLNVTFPADRTYNGYKLLNLSTSLKSHHVDHAGDHTDDCYNYAYTVNDKYLVILQMETHNNGRNELWLNTGGKPSTYSGVQKEQILEYLKGQSKDNGDVYMTMRLVADNLYHLILEWNADPANVSNQILPDAADLEGTKTLNQGYWMFADVTDLPADANASNSLVVVDTKGLSALTINLKTALPTLEKKVKDIEDSEDDHIDDNAWLDTADHDLGDLIPFKLTGTLPSNAQYYKSYKMVFHDTLSAGLTLDASSIQVLMYETKHKADVDTDLNDASADVTDQFTITTTGLTDGCTFEVSCNNVYNITGVTKDTTFVVYYKATLKNDGDAGNGDEVVIGGAGNTNSAVLEFSNNPYDASKTGKTTADTVTVYTYQLVVNKVDSFDHPLEGAGFTLFKKDKAGNYHALGNVLTGDTTFIWKGLDDGDYKLEETIVPAGYNAMSDIIFSLSAEHAETDGTAELTLLDGGEMGAGNTTTGAIAKDVVNHTGVVLPETGGTGTTVLLIGGALLITMAAIFMVVRKKMSIYED